MPGLNRNNVHELEIILPDLKTQNKIAEDIMEIEKHILKLNEKLSKFPDDKESIVKKYLVEGQIR